MFFGRDNELRMLEEAYESPNSELVVIYGRRRIGKSSLVKQFAETKPATLTFEGIEGEKTPIQIRHFTQELMTQTDDAFLESARFQSWEQAFSYLTERVISTRRQRKKQIIFLDELPWMAAGRGRLISLLKYYWDNHWKSRSVMLILCGSIASFMVRKVLHSKALYGRVSVQILLRGLMPSEAAKFFRGRRSREEILKYLLIFGGVPKYLEEVRLNRSFAQNMNRLCFSGNSPLTQEVDRIFYNQFREPGTYQRIIGLLKDRMLPMRELAEKLGKTSGGGLTRYLRNLEDAEIVRSYVPFGGGVKSKLRRYALSDEYLIFYYKYIESNLQMISQGRSEKLFEKLTAGSLDPWLGFAFERFCLKHAIQIAGMMGFEDEVLVAGPYFKRGDPGCQVDLLYKRNDRVITVCEVKHHHDPISTKIIPEMEQKLTTVLVPRGYSCEKALISVYGPSDALRDSGYFDHYVNLTDILAITDDPCL